MDPSATLVDELRRHALIVGEVTLTSGRTAQYYVDAKRAVLRPAGFRAMAELVAGHAARLRATAVGGLTMGADAPACAALAGGADDFAQRLEVAGALDRVGADRRGVLDERLVDVVLDLSRGGPDARHQLARAVGEPQAGGVDEQQLLLDAEGERRRAAEEMLHRVGIIGSAAP